MAPTVLLARELQAADFTTNQLNALRVLCEGPCSAKQLARRLKFRHFILANQTLGVAGRKLYTAASDRSPVKTWKLEGREDKPRKGWYNVIAPGDPRVPKFRWHIRDEIKEAMRYLKWYVPPPRSLRPKS